MTTTAAAPTTTATPAQVMTAAYTAFGAGDMPALGALLAPDILWQVSDTGPLNGTYHGPDEVFAFLGELREQTGGSFSLAIETVLGDDTHACALVRESATRAGRALDAAAVHVFTVEGGRITAFSGSSSDPRNVDFWAD